MERFEHMTLRDAKKDFMKIVKYKDDITVKVRIFEEEDNDITSLDIEITALQDNEYLDSICTDSFEFENANNKEAYDKALKEALKRAKSVQKAVQGWIEYTEHNFSKEIELYNNFEGKVIYTKR